VALVDGITGVGTISSISLAPSSGSNRRKAGHLSGPLRKL